MQSLAIIPIILIISISSFAQTKIDVNVSSLKSVETLSLPALDNASLTRRYKSAQKQSSALRFAEARDVSIKPEKHGTWEHTQDDIMVWRQRIISPNAHSINLAFTSFYLPSSASVFIYNIDKTEIIGPLTKSDNDVHMQYWTPLITGEEVVIELQISSEELEDYKLEISRVNHDFANIQKSFSGACNVDVECGSEDGYPLIDRYRDIIRSVGAYTLGGIDACSGTLINNARNDCTPYFLTADHCGIRTNNASSVVIYWNYQNSTCRQPNGNQSGGLGDGLRNQFNSGSTLRATLDDSDFALLELDDPIDPDLNLYYSGWSRAYELPDTSICVHHPGVEEKRISFDFDRLIFDDGVGALGLGANSDTTHIAVLDWDIGTTEGGSSGSGIFNTKGELIGQLTGGLAACGNDAYDTYGWMNYSWNGAGTDGTSLKPWLDPDNTGLTSMPGRGCSYELVIENLAYQICGANQNSLEIPVVAEGIFENPLMYEVVGAPNGVSADFDFVSNVSTEPNRLVISGLSNIGESSFDITISIDDGVNRVEKTIDIDVYDTNPTPPTISSPADGSENLPLSVELRLSRRNVPQNQFQISTDENFSNILVDELVSSSDYITDNLQQNQLYFWRAKSLNPCGESDWSAVNSFRTSKILCATISNLGDPMIISDEDPSTIMSATNLPYVFNIEDVVINNVTGTHSFVSDINASLSFGGLTSRLFGDICFSGDNFNLGFDDESLLSNIPCPPTSGNLFQPDSPLSVFDGAIATGDWVLNIEDTATDDGGMLQSWSMDVCYSNPVAPIIVPQNNILIGCYDTEIVTNVYLDAGSTIPNYEVQVVSTNSGNIIPSTFRIDATDPDNMTLSITPTLQDDGLATVQLINTDNNNIAFFTVIKLDLSDGSEKPIVMYPQSGAVLNYNQFDHVTWNSRAFSGGYIIEISSDNNFNTIDLSITGDNENDVAIDPNSLVEGQYYLRIGHQNSCGYSYSEIISFIIDSSVDVTDIEDVQSADIFPNPGSGLFYLRTEQPLSEEYNIMVTDIQGKTYNLSVERINANNLKLELTNYPSGVYYINVIDQKYNIKKKIIKI